MNDVVFGISIERQNMVRHNYIRLLGIQFLLLLFTVTAAATGWPEHADVGWRKALRFALTENPLAEPGTNESMQKRGPVNRRKGDSESTSLLLFAAENEEQSPFLESSEKPL